MMSISRNILLLLGMVQCHLAWTQTLLLSGPQASTEIAFESITADQILDAIKGKLTCTWATETVDTYKSGDGKMHITGIATTFLATQEVLEEAARLGLNMVITHEPTFYNHRDETSFFEGDPVFEAKKAFLEENNMVVLRFHDHWHRTQPDGIHVGMVRRLGWEKFQNDANEMIFNMPEQGLHALVSALQEDFDASNMRVVGDSEAMVSKIGMAVGAPGSQNQIRMLRRDDVEVLITGETPEWETVEYVRDAQAQGKRKYLILMGHAHSEEAGMQYCADWLQSFIKEVPIKFVPAGNAIWTPQRGQ